MFELHVLVTTREKYFLVYVMETTQGILLRNVVRAKSNLPTCCKATEITKDT
jgi:hypothetical protein